jgi:hypothetical protein
MEQLTFIELAKNFKLFLFLIFFLTGCSFTAICQKNFDNWIFGRGVYMSFKNGNPEIISLDTHNYCYFALSDDSGNLLFYCSLATKNIFHISDQNNKYIYDLKLEHITSCRVWASADVKNPKLYHVFVYHEKTSDISFHRLHHIKLEITDSGLTVLSDKIYDDRIMSDFVLVPSGDVLRLITFESEKKIRIYNVNDDIALNSETDFSEELKFYIEPAVILSPDCADFYIIYNYRILKIGYDNINGIITGLQNIDYPRELLEFEFTLSGNHVICAEYGNNHIEFVRYNITDFLCNRFEKYELIQSIDVHDYDKYQKANLDMLSGPDGNIYVGFLANTYLSVIENPDAALPECRYISDKIDLGGRKFGRAFQQLPRFSPNFQVSNKSCFELAFCYIGYPVQSYLWDFGDNTEQSTETSPVHVYEKSGKYTVKLTVTFSSGETKTIEKNIVVNPPLEKPKLIVE